MFLVTAKYAVFGACVRTPSGLVYPEPVVPHSQATGTAHCKFASEAKVELFKRPCTRGRIQVFQLCPGGV